MSSGSVVELLLFGINWRSLSDVAVKSCLSSSLLILLTAALRRASA